MATLPLFQHRCELLSAGLRDALERHRALRPQVLARMFGEQEIEDGAALNYLETISPGTPAETVDEWHVELLELMAVARSVARRTRDEVAHMDVTEITIRAAKAHRQDAREEHERKFQAADLAAVRARVPPRLPKHQGAAAARAAAAHEGDPRGRANAEAEYRSKAVEDLVQLLQAAQGGDAGRLRLAAAGRRGKTLRKRVNGWRAYQRWLLAAGRPLLGDDLNDMVDYLGSRAAEPCGRTVLDEVVSVYRFLDDVMGRTGDERRSASPHILHALKEYRLQVALASEDKGRGQALRPPLLLIKMLEEFVVDEGRPRYDRALSWWLLLSAWGVLRFDDHRGLDPASIVVDASGLRGLLTRTKTTGPDKQVTVRELHVGRNAYLAHDGWLVTGWELWRHWNDFKRDYFLLPRSTADGMLHREITYEEYVGSMRRVISNLGGDGDLTTMGDDLAMTFTAHSWRSFLPSAASALGAPSSLLDSLGAWRAKGGEVYARTHSMRAGRVQVVVAESVKNADAAEDILAEADDLLRMRGKLIARGLTEDKVTTIVERFRRRDERTASLVDWKVMDVDGADGEHAGRSGHAAACRSSSSSEVTAAGSSATSSTRARDQHRVPSEVSGYVVSIVKRGGQERRKLHYLGLCHLVPGVDYLRFEELGKSLPDVGAYDSVCGRCWPAGDPSAGQADAEGSSDGSSLTEEE